MSKEIIFKVQHSCAFVELGNFIGPDPIFAYSNAVFDTLVLPGDVSEDDLAEGRELFGDIDTWIVERSGKRKKTTFVTLDCICNDLHTPNVGNVIRELGGFIVYPIRYQGSFEYYRILCRNDCVLRRVLNALLEFEVYEIISIRDLGANGLSWNQHIPLSEITRNMTAKELNTLKIAFNQGYYKIPRNIRIKDIAQDMGKTRQNIEKLVRKAENRIIETVINYLMYLNEEDLENGVKIQI